jgi:cytochrome P450
MGIMGEIFPNGLLLMDGDPHARDRRMMSGAFTRQALRSYTTRMFDHVASAIDGWDASGTRPHIYPKYKALTLKLAASIFLGVDLGDDVRDMNRAFERMVAASMSVVRVRWPGFEFYRGIQGREYMQAFLRGIIAERRANPREDLFSRVCQARDEQGEALDDQAVLDHMTFLMMAAHDTTTSTLTSMTYELARHPEWQERARAESLALGSDAAGDLERVETLETLDWIMRETLRRYPPLPVIPRVATRGFEWQGYQIPAPVMVVLSPIHTHHMEKYWPDPFRFDPERFSPARAEHENHSHAWVPFGGGGHVCIGKRFAEVQVRAVMHQMLCKYRFKVRDDYRMPVQQAPISKPTDGLPVTLERI